MERSQELKSVLHSAMINDFTIRSYNENNFCFCFDFFQLNSVYNGLLYVHKDGSAPRIDWQYTRETKKHKKILEKFSCAFLDMIKHGERKAAFDIVEHYKSATSAIFAAKYTIDEELYLSGSETKQRKKDEESARIFCESIKKLAENPDALQNFESYLSAHFPKWLRRFAQTPEGIAEEIKRFSNIEF